MQTEQGRNDVERVEVEEFLSLLISRRSLERLQPFPRREPSPPMGLRDRRSGVVYVPAAAPSSVRAGSAPFTLTGGAAG